MDLNKYHKKVKEYEDKKVKELLDKASDKKKADILFTTDLMSFRNIILYGPLPDFKNMAIRDKMPHSWLKHQYICTETIINGRWIYWINFIFAGKEEIENKPIPKLSFIKDDRSIANEMLNVCLSNPKLQHYGKHEILELFIDWLLYSFGDESVTELPKDIPDEALQFWYEEFKPQLLAITPYDYFGDLAADLAVGKGQGFFPTPMHVVECMVRMTCTGSEIEKYSTVSDPCLGTGRMLLCASNYSLRLYGQDINALVTKIAKVNGYLYVPWLVCNNEETDKMLEELKLKYSSKEK